MTNEQIGARIRESLRQHGYTSDKAEDHIVSDLLDIVGGGILDTFRDRRIAADVVNDEWRGWVQFVFLDGGTPTGGNKDLRARACARVVIVGNAEDLARRLRERADMEAPDPAFDPETSDETPLITWFEVIEICALLREAADALYPPTGGSQ